MVFWFSYLCRGTSTQIACCRPLTLRRTWTAFTRSTRNGIGLVLCTPSGCMLLLGQVLPSLVGLHAVVVGRSNIVGKPMAQSLLQADCTVTIAHSRTQELPALCRTADVLIAGVGKLEMIRGSWIKPGAVIVDVEINRVQSEWLVGDVAANEACHVLAITPVPRGVRPITIACLLNNTLTVFERANCAFAGLREE